MSDSDRGQRAELSAEETAQRVAILKRLKELLARQRDRFRSYLDLLDSQQSAIQKGDAEGLIAQVELEERIVADIASVQKAVDPLESMYQKGVASEENDIPKLKTALEELKTEAQTRSKRNRVLLTERMDEMRREIHALRSNPFAQRRSVYSDGATAALIDLKG